MESESTVVDRAISALSVRCVYETASRQFELRSLLPVADWRPFKADWWRGKEMCLVGEDTLGNQLFRHCDGTVRFWDRRSRDLEVIAPSVRAFVAGIRPSRSTG